MLRRLSSVVFVSFLMLLFGGVSQVRAASYYVDSATGNDSNTCQQAQSQSTPRRSVSGVTACNPGAGDTVYFRGTFSETINPGQSGQVLAAPAAISGVSGSVVQFSTAPANLSSQTDYITIYGSRKGNSGAFKVVSVSGNQVTVNTADLPGGSFIAETAAEPGELQAAAIRPLHYTAWDKTNPPTWDFNQAMYYSFNRSAVMLSYLRSVSGANNEVWGTMYLDGGSGGNGDFFIADHIEVQNAATSIGISNNDFHANYAILQHNYFHNVGWRSGVSDEVIYWGNFLQYQKHHDYPQIMYNRVGPQKQLNVDSTYGNQAVGDGIEVKASAHNPTIWGNIVTGMYLTNGCDDSPIHSAGENGFIANNYIDNVNPLPNNIPGCAISIVEGAQGANGTIVANNVIRNIKSVGIRIFNTSNVQVYNNTIYDIHTIPGCCAEESAAILVQTYGQPALNNTIRNNIIQNVPVGIGRYPWATSEQFSMTLGNNIVFNASYSPWGVGASPTSTDRVVNPLLVDPASGNFSLSATSPAIGTGANGNTLFTIDNHNAADPTQWGQLPVTRGSSWDVGAYQGTGGTGSSPVPSPSPAVSPTPSPSPNVQCRTADVNQDGTVNTSDRALLLADFFKTVLTTPRTDLNADGHVDLFDYAVLIRSYGQVCS